MPLAKSFPALSHACEEFSIPWIWYDRSIDKRNPAGSSSCVFLVGSHALAGIGFAAEPQNLKLNSKKKLDQKNCDWIIANDISDKTIGFDSDDNEVSIFYKNKESEKLLKKKKSLIASEIVDRVISELN